MIDKLGMSPYSFSRALEVSDATIRQYTHKGSKPGFEILEKIVTVFDNVNPQWLLKGTGDVFINGGNVDNSSNFNVNQIKRSSVRNMGVNNTESTPYIDERCQRELEKMNERYNILESKYFELVDRLLPKS